MSDGAALPIPRARRRRLPTCARARGSGAAAVAVAGGRSSGGGGQCGHGAHGAGPLLCQAPRTRRCRRRVTGQAARGSAAATRVITGRPPQGCGSPGTHRVGGTPWEGGGCSAPPEKRGRRGYLRPLPSPLAACRLCRSSWRPSRGLRPLSAELRETPSRSVKMTFQRLSKLQSLLNYMQRNCNRHIFPTGGGPPTVLMKGGRGRENAHLLLERDQQVFTAVCPGAAERYQCCTRVLRGA